MELQLGYAFIMAALAFFLSIVLGKDIVSLFKSIGAAIVVIPMIFFFLSGFASIQSADPSTATVVADSTITRIVTYIGDKLPGILISEIAGAIVGALSGLVVQTVKGTN